MHPGTLRIWERLSPQAHENNGRHKSMRIALKAKCIPTTVKPYKKKINFC